MLESQNLRLKNETFDRRRSPKISFPVRFITSFFARYHLADFCMYDWSILSCHVLSCSSVIFSLSCSAQDEPMVSFLFLTKARPRATYVTIFSITTVTFLICLSGNVVKSVCMGGPCKLLSAVLAVTMLWKCLAIAWAPQIVHCISLSSTDA